MIDKADGERVCHMERVRDRYITDTSVCCNSFYFILYYFFGELFGFG